LNKKVRISKIKKDYFSSNQNNNNFKKTAIRSGGITIFTRMSTQLIQTFTVFVLARIVTPKDFGLVAMATSVINFFLFFNDMGLTDAIIQQKEINHEQVNALFWISQAVSTVLTLFLIFISPFISWIYKEPELTLIFIISSLIYFISGASSQHRALLKRNMDFKSLAIIEFSSVSISSILSVILALNGWTYWALAIRPIINFSIIFVLSWILCQWRPGMPSRNSNITHLLKFGFNSMITFFIVSITQNMDKTLIGWKYGKESLGFYSRAYYLADIPTNQLSSSLYHVSVSTLSKLREEPDKFRRYYINAISTISFIGMPISAFLVIMCKEIIYILLGPQWGMAATILSIFGLGTGIQLLNSTNSWLHVSLGRPDRWFRWNLIYSSIMIISFIIGLFFNVTGVAIGYICVLFLLTFPALKYAGKPINLRISEILFVIWRYLVCAFLTGVFTLFLFNKYILFPNQIIRLIVSLPLFIIIYLILISIFHMSFKPITNFISIFKNFIPRFSRKEK
jgi:O-antigen/teichoic acid export membrane protein